MVNIEIYSSSPIFLENKKTSIFAEYNNTLFIINEKLLYSLLEKIGFLGCYLEFQASNNQQNIKNWLKRKKLLNAEILESISDYVILLPETKVDLDNLQISSRNIKEENIKNFYKSAIINDFLSKNETSFNNFVSLELEYIKKELGTVTNPTTLKIRKKLYSKNFLNDIIEEFINQKGDYYLFQELDNLANSSFWLLQKELEPNTDFEMVKTSQNQISKKTKSILAINNASFSLEVKKNGVANQFEYLDWLNIIAERFTAAKIEHDKKFFLNKLLKKSKALSKIDSSSNNSTQTALEEKTEITSYCKNSTTFKEVSKTDLEILLLNKCFENIENSNAMLENFDKLQKFSAVINLETENLEQINTLLMDNKTSISSTIASNYTFENTGIPKKGLNFATIKL